MVVCLWWLVVDCFGVGEGRVIVEVGAGLVICSAMTVVSGCDSNVHGCPSLHTSLRRTLSKMTTH